MKVNLAEVKKAAAAAAGLLALAVSSHLLHGDVEKVAEALLSAATVFGVWKAPYKSKP